VLGLAVAHLVALTTMMTLLAAGLPGLGYAQAVMVLVASIGFALVGFTLAFGRNWARAPDVTRELLVEQKRARW
jgi:hypothetical protein